MSKIVVMRELDVSKEIAWAHLADLAAHPTWMKDALSIQFQSEQTTGPGTRMLVPTRVGPLRTNDIIEVVDWVEGSSIRVQHRGLVSGVGEFQIVGDMSRSTITWREELRFPWWLGGPLTAWLAAPILRRIWNGNLDRFASLVER